jgi:hypothetical protein
MRSLWVVLRFNVFIVLQPGMISLYHAPAGVAPHSAAFFFFFLLLPVAWVFLVFWVYVVFGLIYVFWVLLVGFGFVGFFGRALRVLVAGFLGWGASGRFG